MTKSSVNFKAVKSASHAVSHASRSVEPSYLLPQNHSLGTIVVLDDKGNVGSTLEAKMALASRQALREKNYSPVWEGILNLPRPGVGFDADEYKQNCTEIVADWCKAYESSTGHKVLRADIHLDEGHMDDGEALLNAHAHIIADRTNDKGRVIKLSPKQLRELQTATAEVTGLERGKSSFETGRKHIDHQAYKYLAERGRLEVQQQVGDLKATHGKELDKEKSKTARIQKLFQEDTPVISNLKAELAQLKAQYDQDRATLKASGEATQQAYQSLKKAHEEAQAELKATKEKVVEMDEYTKKLEADLAAGEDKIAQALIEKAAAIEALVQAGVKSEALLVTAEGHRDAAAKLTSQSNTMTPEVIKTASEPPKQPEAPIAPPKPAKSLAERLAASWEAMLGWIKSIGAEQEPIGPNTRHDGPVKHLDDLHCVQKTGRRYAVHRLADLDNTPALDDPRMSIKYSNGVGQVTGKLGKTNER